MARQRRTSTSLLYWILFLLVILIAVLSSLLVFFIEPRVERQITHEFNKTLPPNVTFNSVHLNWLSPSVKIQGVRVSSSTETKFLAESISFYPSYESISKRKLIISSMSVKNPRGSLLSFGPGARPDQDLIGTVYRGISNVLSNYHVTDFQIRKTVLVNGEAQFLLSDSERKFYGKNLNAVINLNTRDDRLKIKNLSVKGRLKTIDASLRFHKSLAPQLDRPLIKGSLTFHKVPFTKFLSRIEQLRYTPPIDNIQPTTGTVSGRLPWSIYGNNYSVENGNLSLKNVQIYLSSKDKKPEDIDNTPAKVSHEATNWKGHLQFDSVKLNLKQLRTDGGNFIVKGTTKYDNANLMLSENTGTDEIQWSGHGRLPFEYYAKPGSLRILKPRLKTKKMKLRLSNLDKLRESLPSGFKHQPGDLIIKNSKFDIKKAIYVNPTISNQPPIELRDIRFSLDKLTNEKFKAEVTSHHPKSEISIKGRKDHSSTDEGFWMAGKFQVHELNEINPYLKYFTDLNYIIEQGKLLGLTKGWVDSESINLKTRLRFKDLDIRDANESNSLFGSFSLAKLYLFHNGGSLTKRFRINGPLESPDYHSLD